MEILGYQLKLKTGHSLQQETFKTHAPASQIYMFSFSRALNSVLKLNN